MFLRGLESISYVFVLWVNILSVFITFASMKKITKKRKKQILSKDSSEMTAFEVLYAVPLGESHNLSNVFTPQKILNSFESPPLCRSSFYSLFSRPLKDSERLLIAGQLRLICERGLMAAQIIENGLVEK